MKKIYLLAATALTLSFASGQKINKSKTVQNYAGNSFVTSKAPSQLFIQIANGQNGYGVGNLSAFGGAIYLADDFEILNPATITKITTYGFTTVAPTDLLAEEITEVKIHIFENNNGVPATKPANAFKTITVAKGSPGLIINNNLESSGQLYEISVDLAAAGIDLQLENKKRYWFSIVPSVDFEDDLRYAWFKAEDNKFPGKVHLIDPSDLFEEGFTEWISLDDFFSEPWGDFGLAFSITGDTALGTSELYSNVKPVMATQQGDLLHIFTKNDKLKSADIYATDGKKVASGTMDKLNIGQLPKGVYILNVTLTSGKTESTKFIKR